MTTLSFQRSSAATFRAARLTPFHRILTAVVIANAIVAVLVNAAGPDWDGLLTAVLTAATVNVAIAAVMRQQNVVNAMFAVALAAPRRWPLRIRAAAAQVYQVPGAVHVGGAIAATSWFAVYTVMVVVRPPTTAGTAQYVALLAVVVVILVDLLVMAVCARPAMREARHDLFELTHRYGGWLALVLFGALTVVNAAASPGPAWPTILGSANTWILVGLVIIAALPWLQLRRLPVSIDTPSNHVALITAPTARAMSGSATRIARRPWGQWHSFATMNLPGGAGGGVGARFAVSRAGGWTGQLIDERPTSLWTKGRPTAGMVSVSRVFDRVVWLATGSGIAPCLPQLLEARTPARLVWVTRTPARTYGQPLVDEITAANPDAVVWNSDVNGKADLVELAEAQYRETGAEAVMVVSNKTTTLRVVAELRRRGVPAFGPIWDS